MSALTPPNQYRGIRRIAQACLNCRRKKAKCSGDKPICRNCRRLSQHCQYWDGVGPQPGTSPEASQRNFSETGDQYGRKYNDHLTKRITAVEGKLDELLNAVTSLLPLLQSKASSSPVSSEGKHPDTPSPSYLAAQEASQPPQDLEMHAERVSFDELPPPQIILHLIDLYFLRSHNQPYSFFHEQNFRQRYANGLVPDHLIFAILASSIRFSNDPYFQSMQHDATMAYARSSWNLIVKGWFATESDPDIQICQAITLLSVIDFTAGRQHPGWLKIGLSIRVAQYLRLMLEPDPDLALSYTDQEERRRVFWSIYILDKLCSCGRTRPAALLDMQCQVQLPAHELDFRNGTWKKTQTLNQAFSGIGVQEERLSRFALVVLVASIIGKCAQHMIHEQGRVEGCLPPWDSKSDFAMIHSTLLQLETQFEIGSSIEDALLAEDCCVMGVYDMQIAGQIIFFYALFYTSHCLLQHPFLLYQQSRSRGTRPPASFLSRALQSGKENAFLMSKLLMDAENLGCSMTSSFFGYCTTMCASIHTLYLNDQNPECREQVRQCLDIERAFLERYAQVWKSGETMLSTLDKLALQPSLILTVVAAAPRFELLDPEETANLWTAVDYTAMSRAPTRATSRGSQGGPSPNWDAIFNVNLSMNPLESSANVNTPGMTMVNYDRSSSYNGLIPHGASPLSAFFHDSVMNFGA